MTSARRASLALLMVVLVGGAFAGGYAFHRLPSSRITTAAPTTSTTTPVTTTTGDGAWMSLWPTAVTGVRYASPTSAALAFARHVLKMASPVAQSFQQGDARSGEIPVRSGPTAPETFLLMRQLASDASWWVLGAVASDIEIDAPRSLAVVTSPLRVSGRSTAFEALVNLALYQDGTVIPLARGTAMGGSMGQRASYATSLAFATSSAPFGTLVVFTRSAKDGSVLEASAIRVRFA